MIYLEEHLNQSLFASLVLAVVFLSPSSWAEQPTGSAVSSPVIVINEPKENKVIKLGDTVHVAWKVSGSLAHPNDWDLFVYLQDCAIARVPLYKGPFVSAPNHLNWVFTTSEVTPAIKRGDATSANVWVCLYNRRAGNEELLAMSLSCKAGLTNEVFVCAWGNSTIALKP